MYSMFLCYLLIHSFEILYTLNGHYPLDIKQFSISSHPPPSFVKFICFGKYSSITNVFANSAKNICNLSINSVFFFLRNIF